MKQLNSKIFKLLMTKKLNSSKKILTELLKMKKIVGFNFKKKEIHIQINTKS